jgi:hypothetical protein
VRTDLGIAEDYVIRRLRWPGSEEESSLAFVAFPNPDGVRNSDGDLGAPVDSQKRFDAYPVWFIYGSQYVQVAKTAPDAAGETIVTLSRAALVGLQLFVTTIAVYGSRHNSKRHVCVDKRLAAALKGICIRCVPVDESTAGLLVRAGLHAVKIGRRLAKGRPKAILDHLEDSYSGICSVHG